MPLFAKSGNHLAGISTDEPQVTKLVKNLLNDGGNAVDGAILGMLGLGIANPSSSGIGGGGFCIIGKDEGKKRSFNAIDFREQAPKALSKQKLSSKDLRKGALGVGIPGELAGIAALHKKYGKTDLKEILKRARDFANQDLKPGKGIKLALDYLKPDKKSWHGQFYQETYRLKGLVKLYDQLIKEGIESFYNGDIAKSIIASLKASGGLMTLEDLKAYKVRWREPINFDFAGYEFYAMPPPSSGGIALAQILQLYAKIAQSKTELDHKAFIESMRYAFRDRAQFLGDPDFVKIPKAKMLSEKRLALAAKEFKKTGTLKLGKPFPFVNDKGTTHLVVADRKDGLYASCTSTINTYFGSQVVVEKFDLALNNEMDDFSISGQQNFFGLLGSEKNKIEPYKRPLSSMTPSIGFNKNGDIIMAGGSGGPRIISAVAQTIIHSAKLGKKLSEAEKAARVHHQWFPEKVFAENILDKAIKNKLAKEYEFDVYPKSGAVQAVLLTNTETKSSCTADPRKGGSCTIFQIKKK